MRKQFFMLLVVATVLGGVRLALAQQVKDLTGHDLSAQELIQVLTPKERYRGISLKPPECKHFREEASRGIKPVPKADIAAIRVEFETNSADLTPQAKQNLDQLGQALASAELKPCCFEIQGYTDNTGSTVYNRQLSERRAQSVIDYLVAHNAVEANRMMPKGFGKSHFVASNDTEQGRAMNRRVQVVNLGYGTAATP
jgi:outer membrane protein OmpA-like peptidoglycan-associated protein